MYWISGSGWLESQLLLPPDSVPDVAKTAPHIATGYFTLGVTAHALKYALIS